MKLFIAGLFTETNTRASQPTTMADFEAGVLYRRGASQHARIAQAEPLRVWQELAATDGFEVVEGPFAYATPSGRVEQKTYEYLRDDLIAALESAEPVDIVLLHLHGAMAAERTDDCEGDILARVRHLAPGAFVAVEIDLHAHLSAAMLTHADLIIAYKHYPHVDVADRARDLYRIALAARRGECQPLMASFDCRMIHIWRTLEPSVARFLDRMETLESGAGLLSISFIHGFAHADVADVGARMLVVADGDVRQAEAMAARLGHDLFALTLALPPLSLPMDTAFDEATSVDRQPVVIADVSDNPGGGAPGDSSFLLYEILERKLEDVAIGYFNDPICLAACRDASVGAEISVELGGRGGETSGRPVRLPVTIMSLSDEHWQTAQTGAVSSLGAAAWVRARGGLDIVITEKRQQVLGPDGFERLGIRLGEKRLIVVKSAQHFRRNFDPIAKRIIYADSPGACTLEISRLRYSNRDKPYWPKDADPFR